MEPRQDCVDVDRNISSLSIEVEDKYGKLIALEQLRRAAGEMRILPEVSHCLRFEATVVQVRFQRNWLSYHVGEDEAGSVFVPVTRIRHMKVLRMATR
jgi:hypothetical protein